MVSKLDYFLQMFPPKELSLIVRLTGATLLAYNEPGNTKGEILKFFGVLLLITRFELGHGGFKGDKGAIQVYTCPKDR